MRHRSVGRVRRGARQGLLEPSRVKGAPMQRESPVVSEPRGLRGVYRQGQHSGYFQLLRVPGPALLLLAW